MKYSALVLLLILATVLPAQAQPSQKATATGYSPLNDISYKEARQQALNEAFSRAISEVVGLDVQSETYSSKTEQLNVTKQEGDIFEAFSAVNRSVAYGHVVDYKILEEKVEAKELGDGTVMQVVRITAECNVVRNEEKPDPSFQLKISLNKDVFYTGSDQSDETIITAECTKDAYVTLFSVSGEEVYVLFPNDQAPNNKLEANKKTAFPSKEQRQKGLSICPQLPEGKNKSVEMVFAIATKDPVVFKTEQKVGGYQFVPNYKGALMELNRWLSQIPPSRRVEISSQYEIRRR
ncbi:MAG: DUF4384 domain-containing protein [Chlorobiales bacterium]|nr:DUF4384 domain-containing protein [Chlorobiales bacterium]